MYVYHPVGVTTEQKVRHHQQKTRQHYPVHAILIHHREHTLRVAYLGGRHHPHRHPESSGTLYNARSGLITHYHSHFHATIVVTEITHQIFGIRPVARSKHGQSLYTLFHAVKIQKNQIQKSQEIQKIQKDIRNISFFNLRQE